ncbi:MAG: hypothetical protein KME29_30090 [Calothrix sp. FI2-JRJ7]|jgi:antitoxin (DNA-binding transcriptional repressor) of toxin-antitoxin stability system|nr:hypothetical protein [Calothrix sp. FI2-JRJ7]
MLKVDADNTSITINQLLNQFEDGEEVVILRHGQPIARLSPISHTRRPLPSRAALRATQPLASTSSIEIIQSLRDEARY